MRKHTLNQQGIISIVITIILMLVITLIVLSFAKISRREQRNALDRQLSTQAFYAAETGINDARAELQTWGDTDSRFNEKYLTTCDPSLTTSFAHPSVGNIPQGVPLAGSGQAAYTCVFVDASPTRLIYATSDDQHIIPLRNRTGGALNTVEIFWDNGDTIGYLGCPLPSANNPTAWPADCDAPILRVELVDASSAAGLATSKAFFIYPHMSNGGTISYNASSGSVVQAPCSPPVDANRPHRCRLQITDMSSDRYYVRLKGLYAPLAVSVEANSGVAELIGAQTIIDSTGRANDVERRIQVRVKIGDQGNNLPLYGIAATDKICKRFVIDGVGATDRATPLCWTAANTPN